MPRHAVLAAVMALFVLFVVGHIFQTPYRTEGIILFQGRAPAKDIGAPDERQHANYVARIMKGEGFAVLNPKDPQLYENYQAHQPPLYYLLAAGWGKALGADHLTQDGGVKLRLLSLLFGLGTLAGLWFLGLWATGREGMANAVAAAGLVPMFVGLHGAVSNDPLLFLCVTWSTALLVRFLKEEKIAWALGAGALLGLAALTKTTGVALVPVFLAGAWAAHRTKPGQWKPVLLGLALGLALVAPWWIRNFQVYGDPLAMNAFRDSFTGSAQAETLIAQVGAFSYWTQWVGWWTARSLVGVFGYMDVYLFESLNQARFNQLYLAILFLLAIPFVAGIAWFFRKKEDEDESAPGAGLVLGVLALVVAALFVQFNRQYFQGQGRYLYPAAASLLGFLGIGAESLAARKKEGTGWVFLLLFLGLLNLAFLFQLGSAFALRTAIPS